MSLEVWCAAGNMLYTIYLAQQIIALIEFKTALFSRNGHRCPGDELCRSQLCGSQPDSLAVPPLSIPSPLPAARPMKGLALWARSHFGSGGEAGALGSSPLQSLCLLPSFLPWGRSVCLQLGD